MAKRTVDTIIFTDLDGTLLDHETYSWKPAEAALTLAEKRGIPVVFCTSKTRAEIEVYRESMKNTHPFIVENGAAVFIPRGYFRHRIQKAKKKGVYVAVELGMPYRRIRDAVKGMQSSGIRIRGFGDMSIKEISELTGLSEKEAALAKKREYDEPFILEDIRQEKKVIEIGRKYGLQCERGGRFYHLSGEGGGKGIAVKVLAGLYSLDAGRPPVTVGLGDSPNDFSMLNAVDVPYLLLGKRGKHTRSPEIFIRIDGRGPEAWNRAVTKFIEGTE